MSYTTFKDYLQESGKSERHVARLVGVTQSHINMIKNGSRRPSPELARKIEAVTGIPFRNLLIAEDEVDYRAERAEPQGTDSTERHRDLRNKDSN